MAIANSELVAVYVDEERVRRAAVYHVPDMDEYWVRVTHYRLPKRVRRATVTSDRKYAMSFAQRVVGYTNGAGKTGIRMGDAGEQSMGVVP